MDIAISQTAAQSSPRRFSLMWTLVLHLAPGIAITLAFVMLAWLTVPLGWPPSLALLLTWLIAGMPLLIGILFYQGRQLNGTLSLRGVLLYRQPLPWRQYAWLVPALLVWTALASTLLFSLGESLRLSLFTGWPDWLNLSTLAQNPTQYSSSILWTIVALSAVLNIVVPITEEFYFRSFLLPRLPVSPRWAPLLSTVLFSLYHFWLPWDIIGRIITLLPIVYAVQWKRNVYLSILVHCLLNLIGTIGLAAIVMGGGR
jgi:membrane protease YdiL (CAAX protease family)